MYIEGRVVDKDLSKAKNYIKAAFEKPRAKKSTKKNAKDSWEKAGCGSVNFYNSCELDAIFFQEVSVCCVP